MNTDIEIFTNWKTLEGTIKHKYVPFFLIKNYLGFIISIENNAMLIYKNISILKEDFASFRYIAAIKALKSYDLKKHNHSLGRHFVRIYKSEIRDYCKKMTSKRSQVLNFATSYSHNEYLLNKRNSSSDVHRDVVSKTLLASILEGKNQLTANESQILFAKNDGYTFKELSTKFACNESQANYWYNSAIKKLKQNYKELIK